MTAEELQASVAYNREQLRGAGSRLAEQMAEGDGPETEGRQVAFMRLLAAELRVWQARLGACLDGRFSRGISDPDAETAAEAEAWTARCREAARATAEGSR
jgi:hypothetical protein